MEMVVLVLELHQLPLVVLVCWGLVSGILVLVAHWLVVLGMKQLCSKLDPSGLVPGYKLEVDLDILHI
jgi:hypothetical protein